MNYSFYEFDTVYCGDGENHIPKRAFVELKNLIAPLIADNEALSEETREFSRCLSLGVKGGREVIQFRNYVGTIALPCGATIEILPKIARGGNLGTSRKLVIEMLKASGNIPYLALRKASVETEKLSLFEIYIRFFLNELFVLFKKGFRAGYVEAESNEPYLRGKLLFKEQIRVNSAHRERFFVSHDDFNFNRAENRIIKSTLICVRRLSHDEGNLRDIRRFLLIFDGIEPSENVERDFAKCASDRSSKDYAPVLDLCKIFLKKKGFDLYGSAKNVIALLFPMEKLFEKYIAHEMRGYARANGWTLREQDVGLSLFDDRQFALRPDILLERNGQKIIVDTKWKRLSAGKNANYGISQADMYQMYAYHTRYRNVVQVILLYPLFDPLAIDDYVIREKSVRVNVRFFDLAAHMQRKSFEDCIIPHAFLVNGSNV